MRLTHLIRDQIVVNAVAQSPIPGRKTALAARSNAFAETCRIQACGGEVLESKYTREYVRIAKTRELLPDALKGQSNVVRYSHQIKVFTPAQKAQTFEFTNKHGQYEHRVTPESILLDHSDPLLEEFEAIIDEMAAIKKDEKQLQTAVKAAVYSVISMNQLLEIWPEAKALLPKPEEQDFPVAVRADALNSMIGLPK